MTFTLREHLTDPDMLHRALREHLGAGTWANLMTVFAMIPAASRRNKIQVLVAKAFADGVKWQRDKDETAKQETE